MPATRKGAEKALGGAVAGAHTGHLMLNADPAHLARVPLVAT